MLNVFALVVLSVFLGRILCQVYPPQRNKWRQLTMQLNVCSNGLGGTLNLSEAVRTSTLQFHHLVRHQIYPSPCLTPCHGLCGQVTFVQKTESSPAVTKTVLDYQHYLVTSTTEILESVADTQQTLHAILLHEILHVYGFQHDRVNDATEDSMGNYVLHIDSQGRYFQELEFLQLTRYDVRDLWGYLTLPPQFTGPRNVDGQRQALCTAMLP